MIYINDIWVRVCVGGSEYRDFSGGRGEGGEEEEIGTREGGKKHIKFYLVKNNEEIIEFSMKVSANRYLFRYGGGRLIQVGKFFQFFNAFFNYSCHVFGM